MNISDLASLDNLLRNVTKRKTAQADGETLNRTLTDSNSFSISTMLMVLVLLAMFYGLCMGSYSLFKPLNLEVSGHGDRWLQMLASMMKVPLLYALTILVTFPSLYVFSALVGTQLNFNSFIRLMITLLAINLAVLASLGPIVAFFSVSTINYRFMQLFNVGMFAIAGALGLAWLLQVIRDLSDTVMEPRSNHSINPTAQTEGQESNSSEEASADGSTTEETSLKLNTFNQMPVKWIFRIWIVAFCLVGSQLGWVLRPFIGNPDIAFTWFRERDSNFFLAVLDILRSLLTL